MTSFINMMASDRWSDDDILNRTEAMITAEFTPAQVAVLNRIATAAAIGQYTLTAEEQGEIARYNTVCLEARAAGDAARADMRLLDQVLDYEAAQRVVVRASEEVLAVAEARRPAPEPVVETRRPRRASQPETLSWMAWSTLLACSIVLESLTCRRT
jgi:hypothetical protein